MQHASASLAVFIALAFCVAAREMSFLKSGLIAESDVKAYLSDELLALGARTRSAAHQHLEEIKGNLGTMFTSLPKNEEGKLTHQAVRYALHRFFVRRHGWSIRGLEPNNDTWHAVEDSELHNSGEMKEWVPSYLQGVLEHRLGHEGTDLNQLSALAAALEDLVHKETKGRLETTYAMHDHDLKRQLARDEVDDLILTYYVAFLDWGEFQAASREESKAQIQQFIAQYTGWAEAKQWVEDLKAKHLVALGNGKYDFQGVQEVLDKVGEEYYTLNDRDCVDLKSTLEKMQGQRPGRVRLSTFYNKGMYSHWDFSEKREYLSSLGALDESDAKHPSLIIANYALSRPNCLDSSHLFTICCRDECEDLLGHLEGEIGGAMAEPERLAKLMAAMPSATVASHRELPSSLLEKLAEIAARHGGQVPLHGRLFAQWMHHAYPLECPYPHELGAVNPLTRSEWMKETGQETEKASTEEKMEHIASDTCAANQPGAPCAGETSEIPWSDKEELLTWHLKSVASEYDAQLSSTPPCSSGRVFFICAVAAMGLLFVLRNKDMVAWRPFGITAMLALVAFSLGLLDGALLVLVLGFGLMVVIANQMSTRPLPMDEQESKQSV